MILKYKVQFYSQWHCSSGLGAGAVADCLVVKNRDGLPYIPGKTIKGLLREALEEINSLGTININALLGNSSDTEAMKGGCFFTNASLSEQLSEEIKREQVQHYFFKTISSTAIEDSGIAKLNSLRQIEVTIPCILEGEILDVPDDVTIKKSLMNGLKFIKRLGLGRNRGLGRCAFTLNEEGGTPCNT